MKKTKLVIVGILFLVIGLNARTNFRGNESIDTPENDTILAVVDKDPEFPGGAEARIEFISRNIKYPEDARLAKLSGRVNVQFVVNSVGQVIRAKVVKKVSPSLDEEALRVVNSFPRWIPAEQNGKKVPAYQVIQVAFKYAPAPNTEESWQLSDTTLIVIDSLKLPLRFNADLINPEIIDTGLILKPFPEEARKKLIQQYGQEARNGVLLLKTYDISNALNDTTQRDDNYIFKQATKMPQFPGGESALLKYVSKNLKYPTNLMLTEVQGTVVVRFVIDRMGKVREPKVVTSIDEELDRKALKVIQNMPDWEPGETNGKKVNVYFTLPIGFRIERGSNRPNSGVSVGNIVKRLVILNGQVLPSGFGANWFNYSKLTSMRTVFPTNKNEINRFIENYGKSAENGIIIVTSPKVEPVQVEHKSQLDSAGVKIYDVVEEMPIYPGGYDALVRSVFINQKYPDLAKENKIEGTVYVRFVVNSLGVVEKAEVLRGISPECDNEALRVINLLDNWIPGKQNGRPVNVYYIMPVEFRLYGDSKLTKSISGKADNIENIDALNSFFLQNIRYPIKAVEAKQKGVVLVGFTVTELGQVDNIKILSEVDETAVLLESIVATCYGMRDSQGISHSLFGNNTSNVNYLQDEAIRLVKSMEKRISTPTTKPKISGSFVLPILFEMK
jgi:TonB family protein